MAILLICWTIIPMVGQERTLFDHLQITGGFGGPLFETGLGGDGFNSIGGGGGVLLDGFFLGGYGIGAINDFELAIDNQSELIDFGHGGLWLGYYTPSNALLHFYSSVRVGWGEIEHDRFQNLDDGIFVFTPEAGIELNVTSWFRISTTLGYRLVNGISDKDRYDGLNLSGPFIGTTLRFGASF